MDKEHTRTNVTLTYKYGANPISTPGDFFQKTVEEAFKLALDNRLYKLMRKPDPDFFSATCGVEEGTYCISQIPRLFYHTRLTLSFIYRKPRGPYPCSPRKFRAQRGKIRWSKV